MSPHATTMNSIKFAKLHDPSFAKACLTKTVSKVQSALKSNSKLFFANLAELKAAAIASATKPPTSFPARLRGVLKMSLFPSNNKLSKKLRFESTRTTSFDLIPTPSLAVVEALEQLDPVQLLSKLEQRNCFGINNLVTLTTDTSMMPTNP